MTTAIECVGGWLVIYSVTAQWVSAVSLPVDASASVWMVPGWASNAD
ncbi:MAG TPA: hypothetical protein VGG62_11570 [Terracidiphilus sp.]|jgi:hypothetical protein